MKHNPGFLKLVEEARQQIHECTIEQVKGKLDRHEPFEFIDVRKNKEYARSMLVAPPHGTRCVGVLQRCLDGGWHQSLAGRRLSDKSGLKS